MANVPFSGVPSVEENPSPTPLQHINAPAEAFGANVAGQGLGEIGEAQQKTSDVLAQHAIQMASLNAKQAADDLFVKNATAMDQFRADYQANNAGMAAYQNLPDAYKQIENLRSQGADALPPIARIDYEANSRRALMYTQSSLTSFAQDQRKKSLLDTNNATVAFAINQAAAKPNDPVAFDAATKAIADSAIWSQNPGTLGLSEDVAKEQMYKNSATLVKGVALGLMASDPVQGPQQAWDFYEKHRDDLGLEAGPVGEAILSRLKPIRAANMADTAWSAALGSTSNFPTSFQQFSATNQKIEGTGQNPNSSAEGYHQFTANVATGKGTWFDLMKGHPELTQGKNLQQIADMRNDPNIAEQMFFENTQRNGQYLEAHGLFANAASLGMAHFLGPAGTEAVMKSNGNTPISQVLPPEVIAANHLKASETTSQLGAYFAGKYGTGQVDFSVPSSDQKLAMVDRAASTAMSSIQNDPTLDPIDKLNAQRGIESRYNLEKSGIVAGYNGAMQQLYSQMPDPSKPGQNPMPFTQWVAQPNVASVYSSLSRDEQNKVQNSYVRAINPSFAAMAPEQQQSWQAFKGVMASGNLRDVSALKADPLWPPSIQAEFHGDQIRANQGVQTQVEKETRTALGDKVISKALQGAGIHPGSPTYNQFVGYFSSELNNFSNTSQGNRAPSVPETRQMASEALSKSGFFGPRTFQPPADYVSKYQTFFKAKNGRLPNDNEVGEAFQHDRPFYLKENNGGR